MDYTGEKDKHYLTKESAAAILTVAFNAISVRYITKGQLCPASTSMHVQYSLIETTRIHDLAIRKMHLIR